MRMFIHFVSPNGVNIAQLVPRNRVDYTVRLRASKGWTVTGICWEDEHE